MFLLQITLRIVYYILPLLFSIPYLIAILLFREKSMKKLGKEEYIKRLKMWTQALQIVFILEAFLTFLFIFLYGLGEGIVGAVHLILIFIARTMGFTFIKGYETGVLK